MGQMLSQHVVHEHQSRSQTETQQEKAHRQDLNQQLLHGLHGRQDIYHSYGLFFS